MKALATGRVGICLLALVCVAVPLRGEKRTQAKPADSGQETGYPASAPVPAPPVIPGAILLDRVVAVINSDVILQSDVNEEERFAQLQPFYAPGAGDAEQQALQRDINRTLILQQIKQQKNPIDIAQADFDRQVNDLRTHLPACAGNKCKTEAGWQSVLATYGFTEDQFNERWRQRMQVLEFIEQRFRAGVRISKPEIQAYYNDNFVPQFQKRKLPPPALSAVSARIDEILLQQHLNGLLTEWLNSLKSEGSLAILDPRYADLGTANDQQMSDQQEEAGEEKQD